MNHSDNVSNNSEYELGLEGYKVDRCMVDNAFRLVLGKDYNFGKAEITIEGIFTISSHKHTQKFTPGKDLEGLGPALKLLRLSIVSAEITNSGNLVIGFEDGSVLRAPTDSQYESWDIAGPNGRLIIGGPHGRVSVFAKQKE